MPIVSVNPGARAVPREGAVSTWETEVRNGGKVGRGVCVMWEYEGGQVKVSRREYVVLGRRRECAENGRRVCRVRKKVRMYREEAVRKRHQDPLGIEDP